MIARWGEYQLRGFKAPETAVLLTPVHRHIRVFLETSSVRLTMNSGRCTDPGRRGGTARASRTVIGKTVSGLARPPDAGCSSVEPAWSWGVRVVDDSDIPRPAEVADRDPRSTRGRLSPRGVHFGLDRWLQAAMGDHASEAGGRRPSKPKGSGGATKTRAFWHSDPAAHLGQLSQPFRGRSSGRRLGWRGPVIREPGCATRIRERSRSSSPSGRR
jgi:hypothetical protein